MYTLNFKQFCTIIQIIAFVLAVSGTAAAQGAERPDPEMATGFKAGKAATGEDFMIVTANPYATQAGYDILKKGGSAADAAITAQLVLGLVEPQSSGLGGGAFVLHYDADKKELVTLDGRETAPSLAGPFMFYRNGAPMGFKEAVVGGRAVGVPGTPALLKDLHQLHGQLTWMELFDEPIRLAEEGFEISPRLAAMIEAHKDDLSKFDESRRYFLDFEGVPVQAGETLTNPAYEETLRDYAFYGPSRFYRGALAGRIVETVQNIEDNPGLLSLHDFREYAVKKRKPVCGPYRTYIVCSMGEPSSGALTLLQILGMVERFDLAGWGPENPKSWHVLAEASRLAFADRGRYMADPDFANTPGVKLLDPTYIAARSALIKEGTTLKEPRPGKPPHWDGPLYADNRGLDRPGTSHISVIDANGDIVSMTTTIEGAFGAHVMVDGFLLNNELTDFAFSPFDADGALVANMAEGGKRPRSSMSPTIVFDADGAPVLVLGSAGGSNIIGYVAQRIIAVLDWGMDIDAALAMPNIVARGEVLEFEVGAEAHKEHLENSGNKVEVRDKNSGLTAIHIKAGVLYGAADPRREGLGRGQ